MSSDGNGIGSERNGAEQNLGSVEELEQFIGTWQDEEDARSQSYREKFKDLNSRITALDNAKNMEEANHKLKVAREKSKELSRNLKLIADEVELLAPIKDEEQQLEYAEKMNREMDDTTRARKKQKNPARYIIINTNLRRYFRGVSRRNYAIQHTFSLGEFFYINLETLRRRFGPL